MVSEKFTSGKIMNSFFLKKQVIIGAVLFVASVFLLWKDALHFSVPIALFICIFVLWKRVKDMLQEQLEGYQRDIVRDYEEGESLLLQKKKNWEAQAQRHGDLEKTLEMIAQSAHQEAALLLRNAQRDMDAMEDNQRRQFEIQKTVLRQKWKAAMGKELIDSMREYLINDPELMPTPKQILSTVSNKLSDSVNSSMVSVKEK